MFNTNISSEKKSNYAGLDTAKITEMEAFFMKTVLKKKEKFTRIYFNESTSSVDIFTHNSVLKRRLREYCGKYPDAAHLIQEDEFGGAQYEIAKGRFSVRLTAPYSDERRKNASDLARKNKNAERLNKK